MLILHFYFADKPVKIQIHCNRFDTETIINKAQLYNCGYVKFNVVQEVTSVKHSFNKLPG